MKNKAHRTSDSLQQRLQIWLRQHYTPDRVNEALALPLRRDMITFLHYVGEHKIVGTRSTGNMPLKAIRELAAQFVHPPQLDETIGDHVFKLRTEYDVWPLYFIHILASVGGLLLAEPGRRWLLTPNAVKYLDADPVFQLALLLETWWFDVNWLVAYPWAGMGESLPQQFKRITLSHLRRLYPGNEVSFNAFADELIDETKLTWTAPSPEGWHRSLFLRTAIEQMVIDVLEDFGAVSCQYHARADFEGLKDLRAFEITPLGAALLASLLVQERE